MKTTSLFLVLPLALCLVGCKKEEPSTPAGEASSALADAKKSAQKAADAVQETAKDAGAAINQAAKDATAAVDSGAKTATDQAQALIDKVKELINSKQFKDAGPLLEQLSKLKLTPEQQQTLADLKAKLQAALVDKQ